MRREHLLRKDWIVSRARIRDMLCAGLQHPMICVTAGHGYGKTTAVADFCRDTSRRLIWIHLLPIDNDTQRFWRKFLDAIKHELAGLEKALRESNMEFPDTIERFDDFLRVITKEGYRSDDVLLVFDNVESVENEVLQEFIAGLSLAELENLCVILISNKMSTLRKYTGTGKHYHIGSDDLRFTSAETTQLLAHYGQQVHGTELKRLQEYTGGWPLALYLIASQPRSSASFDFGGTPNLQVITGLFEQNYYANFSDEIRRLLIKIALLPSANMGLVQTLGALETNCEYPALLHNAFISYTYPQDLLYLQKMYHEFLAHKKQTLADTEITALYAMAADWYKEHKYYREAMECYWRIRDYGNFLEIMKTPIRRWQSREFTNWILDKLNHFPTAFCEDHEEVNLFRGLMYINDAQVNRGKETLLSAIQRLEERRELPPEKKILLGILYVVMTDISVMQNNREGLDYAPKALELLPSGAQIRTDEMMVAGNNETFFLPDNRPGSLECMYDYAARMNAYTEKLHHRNGRGYFDLFAAEASFLGGNTLQAWENSTRALYIAKHAHQHDIAANALFLQMRLALFQGDGTRAESSLHELTEYVEEKAPHDLVGLKDCALALFHLHIRDLSKIPLWLTGNDYLPSDIPLDVGRDRIICALYLYATGNYGRACGTLLELEHFYCEKKQWSIQVNALILQAACLLQLNDKSKALEVLYRVYDMTWQNGIVVCFAELGRDMLHLLLAVTSQDGIDFDPRWVEAVKNETMGFVKRQTMMLKQFGTGAQKKRKKLDKLTPREAEVFSYWSQGLSRDEVADILKISTHGVKKHVENIYLKLGAVNRLDAIHIATANGLLGEKNNPRIASWGNPLENSDKSA
jgi:ATP-dependent transcriptional regulator